MGRASVRLLWDREIHSHSARLQQVRLQATTLCSAVMQAHAAEARPTHAHQPPITAALQILSAAQWQETYLKLQRILHTMASQLHSIATAAELQARLHAAQNP